MYGKLAPLLCISCLLLIACEADPQPTRPSLVVRDSASVRIVEYQGPLTPLNSLRVGKAIYRHGSGPSHYLFERIVSGALRSDGSAIIGDAGSSEVVLLDPAGSTATIIASSGKGPHEVQRLVTVHAGPDETTIVEDDGNSRILVFADQGVVRSIQMDGMLALGLMVEAVDKDGYLLMSTSSFRSDAGDGWIPGYMVRLHLDSVALPDTVASYDLALSRPRGEPYNPFGPGGRLSAAPNGFVYGRTDRAEIVWREPDGRVRQIVRWVPLPVYPTPEDVNAFSDEYRLMLARINPGMPAERIEGVIDELNVSFEEPVPFFQRIQALSDGSVWMTHFQPRNILGNDSREYIAVSADGDGLRMVVFPESVRILDVMDGKVLGVVSDEMDVEYIVVYER